MSTDETYNGYTNRETWAVALYINNNQQWQESVLEALREGLQPNVDQFAADFPDLPVENYPAHVAGEIVRENVEAIFDIEAVLGLGINGGQLRDLWMARDDIGSLWRVNWDELGANFLQDAKELA